jgi:TonB family protein
MDTHNKAFKKSFLFSLILHILCLFLLGRMIPERPSEYRIEVDIKTMAPVKNRMNIPRPGKSLGHIRPTPLLKKEVSLKNLIPAIHNKGSGKNRSEYPGLHEDLIRHPEPSSHVASHMRSIIEGVRNIPIPGLPTRRESKTDATDAYLDSIFTHIERFRTYPVAAKRQGLEGTVRLAFLLYRNGALGDIRVTESSHYTMLDHAAIENIRAGDPYPPFPSDLEEKSLWIDVPIVFLLEKNNPR